MTQNYWIGQDPPPLLEEYHKKQIFGWLPLARPPDELQPRTALSHRDTLHKPPYEVWTKFCPSEDREEVEEDRKSCSLNGRVWTWGARNGLRDEGLPVYGCLLPLIKAVLGAG